MQRYLNKVPANPTPNFTKRKQSAKINSERSWYYFYIILSFAESGISYYRPVKTLKTYQQSLDFSR